MNFYDELTAALAEYRESKKSVNKIVFEPEFYCVIRLNSGWMNNVTFAENTEFFCGIPVDVDLSRQVSRFQIQ